MIIGLARRLRALVLLVPILGLASAIQLGCEVTSSEEVSTAPPRGDQRRRCGSYGGYDNAYFYELPYPYTDPCVLDPIPSP